MLLDQLVRLGHRVQDIVCCALEVPDDVVDMYGQADLREGCLVCVEHGEDINLQLVCGTHGPCPDT
jgi:hypothetical protein